MNITHLGLVHIIKGGYTTNGTHTGYKWGYCGGHFLPNFFSRQKFAPFIECSFLKTIFQKALSSLTTYVTQTWKKDYEKPNTQVFVHTINNYTQTRVRDPLASGLAIFESKNISKTKQKKDFTPAFIVVGSPCHPWGAPMAELTRQLWYTEWWKNNESPALKVIIFVMQGWTCLPCNITLDSPIWRTIPVFMVVFITMLLFLWNCGYEFVNCKSELL